MKSTWNKCLKRFRLIATAPHVELLLEGIGMVTLMRVDK